MKNKLSFLWFITLLVFGCDNPVSSPNHHLERKNGSIAVEMNYSMKRTSFQEWSKQAQEKAPEINRTIPIIRKEKIEFKIFQGGEAEVFVEKLPGEESFFLTEAKPGKEKLPEAKFYRITNGRYSVYDANQALIFEQSAPRMNFSDALAQIRNNVMDASTLPAMVTGGGVYVYKTDRSGTSSAVRTSEHPLHNQYDDDPLYDVIRESYVNKNDGRAYIQETIVKKANKTMVSVSLYSERYELLTRTSFRYGGTESSPLLLATFDNHYERRGNEVIKHITVTEYENFKINFNL